jgi:hypothetical protein
VGANEVRGILRNWKNETGFRGDSKGIFEEENADGMSSQQDGLQTTMFGRLLHILRNGSLFLLLWHITRICLIFHVCVIGRTNHLRNL